MKNEELSQIKKMLQEQGYIDDGAIAMSIFLAMKLEKPLLVEGPAGVGKTEIAKVMAKAMKTDLIRLQCYEGLDSTHALYEWNYQHQLLYLKMQESKGQDMKALEETIFSDKFLLKRPVLNAITHPEKAVLLLDEIDRADEEFESFLLEVLSDWQVTIPEIGTIKATNKPQIILTGNRLREMKLEKTPGISETIDWARALASMHLKHLDKQTVEDTLGVVLKDWQDMRHTQDSLSELLDRTGVTSRIG